MMKAVMNMTLISDGNEDVVVSFEMMGGALSLVIKQGDDIITIEPDDADIFAKEISGYVKLARTAAMEAL